MMKCLVSVLLPKVSHPDHGPSHERMFFSCALLCIPITDTDVDGDPATVQTTSSYQNTIIYTESGLGYCHKSAFKCL